MFAMYLVCVLHVLGQGGILSSVNNLSVNYAVAWSLELIAFVAVNCFALASGYVGFNAKFKPNKIFYLWTVTVFYGVLITFVFFVTSISHIGFVDWKNSFTPFLSGNFGGGYWYFTAYVVTFLLMPFYNYLINNVEREKIVYLIIILFILFSLIPAIKQNDYFSTNNGYSYVWISILYLIGGYIGKYKLFKNVKTYKLLFLITLTFIFVCLCNYILNWYIVNYLHQDIRSQADVLSNPYGKDANYLKAGMFANYTFPTTLLAAIILLLLFSRINIKNNFAKSKISSFTPLVFSVYLIHTNKLVFENILSGLFESYATLNPVLLALAVLGTALAIFVICIMIDMLRFELFKLLKVDKLCILIENKLRICWNRLFEKKSMIENE